MLTAPKAKIVHIEVEQGTSGAYFATSPELKGLQVACMTLEEIQNEIPRAITEMYAAYGLEVIVAPVDNNGHHYDRCWVAVPTSAAKSALAGI